MKTPRVYVDTSVIGGCFDPEFSKWSNGLMHDFSTGILRPVVSTVVETELENAPLAVRECYEDLLEMGAEIVEVTDAALDLYSHYLARNVLGIRYENDMLHIALATVADVDVLVSWNFKHIVRFDKIRLFNAANLELGYKTLQIHSPQEVASHERDSAD